MVSILWLKFLYRNFYSKKFIFLGRVISKAEAQTDVNVEQDPPELASQVVCPKDDPRFRNSQNAL